MINDVDDDYDNNKNRFVQRHKVVTSEALYHNRIIHDRK